MAVATDDGLIVPVINDAHTKGWAQIGREARELAKRARERKLPPRSTVAAPSPCPTRHVRVAQFTAIINPPEAAILAVGTTETKAVFEHGAFVPRQRCASRSAADHRVIDGAVGARSCRPSRTCWNDRDDAVLARASRCEEGPLVMQRAFSHDDPVIRRAVARQVWRL